MDLRSFVKAQLRQGRSPASIRHYVISRGYDPRLVEQALQAQTIRHEIHFAKSVWIALALFVVVSGGALLGVFLYQPSEALLDLQTRGLTTEVEAGSDLRFSVELISLGGDERFDVELRHTILDSHNSVVAFSEESVAVETRSGKESMVAIPSNLGAGTYTARTAARYQGKIATAAFSFTVMKSSDELDDKPDDESIDNEIEQIATCPRCSDGDVCTHDLCSPETKYECRYEPITPCCGNGICEPGESFEGCGLDCPQPVDVDDLDDLEDWEKVEAVKQIGDPDKAGELCLSIVDVGFRGECFVNLALSTGFADNCNLISRDSVRVKCVIDVAVQEQDSSICGRLDTDVRRDGCYTEFYLELQDYSVCGLIVNGYLRDSCDAFSTQSS